MPDTDEPTAALTSRSAVVAAVLLFGAVLAMVLLVQARPPAPTADPDLDEPVSEAGAMGIGSKAPEITLTSLDGEVVSLSDYAGRPVLVNFWASWCPPCRAEFPLLADARATFAGDGFEILGVTVNDAPGSARDFVERSGAQWPILLDSAGVAWEAYAGVGLPTSVFVGRDGVIKDVRVGPVNEATLAEHLGAIGLEPG